MPFKSGLRAVVPAVAGLLMLAGTATAREFVYVESPRAGEVIVFDAASLTEVKRIPIGDHTDDVIGSPDGRFVYANAGISDNNPLAAPSEGGKVVGIDTSTNTVVWKTFVDGFPNHLSTSKDGRRLYVPIINRSRLDVIDTATGRVVDRWFATPGHHSTMLSPDGTRLYVGNVYTNAIYVYDTGGGDVIQTYPTRDAVRPLDVSPDGREVYYQISNFHGFEVRDTESGARSAAVDLPSLAKAPANAPNGTFGHGIAVTPDGARLLVVGTIAKYLAVYDRASRKLIGTVPVGDDANWVRVSADSRRAFVSNRGNGNLSVIDLSAMKEIARLPTGLGAGRLAVVNVPDK